LDELIVVVGVSGALGAYAASTDSSSEKTL